jgi:hypothetical protein
MTLAMWYLVFRLFLLFSHHVSHLLRHNTGWSLSWKLYISICVNTHNMVRNIAVFNANTYTLSVSHNLQSKVSDPFASTQLLCSNGAWNNMKNSLDYLWRIFWKFTVNWLWKVITIIHVLFSFLIQKFIDIIQNK